MKISTGGIGTVATAISSSKAYHAAASSSSYPDDWAWSIPFGDAAVATAVAASKLNFGFDAELNSAGDGVRLTRNDVPAKGATSYMAGIDITSLSASLMSSSTSQLSHGDENPNGVEIDFTTDIYVTYYMKIISIAGSPTLNVITDPGREAYWTKVTGLTAGSNWRYSETKTIRRTLTSFGNLTTIDSGAYGVGEYISISYNMSIEGGFAGSNPPLSWGAGLVGPDELKNLGGLAFVEPGDVGTVIDVYGFVVSSLDNTNSVIFDPTIPLSISA